jgi:hypothetical protein
MSVLLAPAPGLAMIGFLQRVVPRTSKIMFHARISQEGL